MISAADRDRARTVAQSAPPLTPQGRDWLADLLQPSTTIPEQDPTL